ncbi:MAG TPA: hypothetical protein VHS55_03420 [Solirubrobacteraceae bacterium]|nr:hypothetical protein [Solirubrobacteraceae bacterium]
MLDAYRKLNPLKGTKPEQLDKNLQRAALRRLDSTEATKQLATEILSRFTGNPAEHAELLEAWESARQGVVEEPVLKRELADLTTVLTMPELTGRLKDKIDPYLAANVQSASPEAMARADPVLLALAATNRAQFIDRYVHMMRGEPEPRTKFLEKHGIAKFEASYDKRTLNAIDLRADIDKDMGSRVKSVASEATATFNVAKEMGLSIIKSDSTSKGETNQRGIDIVGVQPNPAIGPRLDQVRVHVFDDKAVAANRLGDVSALTENLAENLKRAAEGPLAKLAADEKAGLPVDPDHKAALAQMMAASKAIADIDARKLPKTGSKDSNAPAYQQLAYADAVAKVLSEHGIYLHITSEYGQVMDLAAWVKRYGFLLWDKQLNEPGGSISIAPPTPPPTPTPSPTPSPGP